MMLRLVARYLAGFDGPLDGSLEVFPAGIAEWFLEVARKPEFYRGGVSLLLYTISMNCRKESIM